jgi:hypothetical protein
MLMRDLADSYRGQLDRYCALRDITRQLMGKLVLSRGDFSAVTGGMAQKRELLDAIEAERARVAHQVRSWEERKAAILPCEERERLSDVLERITVTIKEFLDDETQLRSYLEGCIARAGNAVARQV